MRSIFGEPCWMSKYNRLYQIQFLCLCVDSFSYVYIDWFIYAGWYCMVAHTFHFSVAEIGPLNECTIIFQSIWLFIDACFDWFVLFTQGGAEWWPNGDQSNWLIWLKDTPHAIGCDIWLTNCDIWLTNLRLEDLSEGHSTCNRLWHMTHELWHTTHELGDHSIWSPNGHSAPNGGCVNKTNQSKHLLSIDACFHCRVAPNGCTQTSWYIYIYIYIYIHI